MSSLVARSACRELGLKDVLDGKGRHSATVPSNETKTIASNNATASNETLCLPADLTVPTAKTCSASPGCLKVKHWRCAQGIYFLCFSCAFYIASLRLRSYDAISSNLKRDFYLLTVVFICIDKNVHFR